MKRKKANNEEIPELGNIVDFYEEEVKITPSFIIDSVDMDECGTTGKFIFKGSFTDDITESIKFDLLMTYPESEVKCEYIEAKKNENVEMTCKVHEGFKSVEALIIEQVLVKKKNKEMFIIQRKEIQFEENKVCIDYNTVKSKIVRNRKNIKVSFLQLSKFNPRPNFFSFFLALVRKAITDIFKPKYTLTVKLKLSTGRRLRALQEYLSGIQVDCVLNEDLQSDYAAGFDCSNTDSFSGTPSEMEIETSEIEDIQGIPENANPKKLSYKIDYSNLDNLKNITNLPSAEISSINGTTCIADGEYRITATLDKNQNLEKNYSNVELRFAAPESTGLCEIKIQNKNMEMICQNAEKFHNSSILIERQVIQDSEGKEIFFIEYYDSEDNQFACDISLNSLKSDTNDNTPSKFKYYKNGNNGLSGGAIAGIIISIVVAVVIASVLAILIRKRKLLGRKTHEYLLKFGH